MTKIRDYAVPLSYSFKSSFVFSLLEALEYLGESLSSRVRLYPLKIGDWGFKTKPKGESFYNMSIHLLVFTLVMRCH